MKCNSFLTNFSISCNFYRIFEKKFENMNYFFLKISQKVIDFNYYYFHFFATLILIHAAGVGVILIIFINKRNLKFKLGLYDYQGVLQIWCKCAIGNCYVCAAKPVEFKSILSSVNIFIFMNRFY